MEWEPEDGPFNKFPLYVIGESGREQEFMCTPDNTTLFTHPPQHRAVDHLFVQVDPGMNQASFLFREKVGDTLFETVSTLMRNSGLWRLVYLPQPYQEDVAQFAEGMITIPDSIPPDFR